MNCGLLGRKLGHSYSPQIHQYLGSYSYELFEKEPEELSDFFKSKNFTGINVTIPYKKDVIPYCDKLSETAKKLGSVNTIVKQSDGTLIGHNTDYYGFMSMLQRTGLDVKNKKVLVLGSGGASVTVMAVLQELGANTVQISRTGGNNYTNLYLHRDTAVIVNATPVGMYPNNGSAPVDIEDFPILEGVLDLIYNPARTKLLLDAEAKGLKWENGLWMLVAQAKESAQWFTGKQLNDAVIAQIHSILSRQMKNIALIGMPGCGKSTVGKLLAQVTGRRFVDVDVAIEETAQMKIPDIFSNQGEEVFRAIESQVLANLGKCSGYVIATGGGCVTKQRNYEPMHQNSTIIWLKRPIEHLPTEGRPLSQANDLDSMYQARKPLYAAFADHCVSNVSNPEMAVEQILELLRKGEQ